ncbi:hypothetical protein ACP70R_041764 [Stipagrostis hirtigluma subsp. patula]
MREVPGDDADEEARGRHRRLLERFMASFGPQSRCVHEARKVLSRPCVIYTMKISVKKAQISWSHRSCRRFSPARRCHTFPIALCRVVEHDQVEQVIHRSGDPGEPDQPGVLPGVKEAAEVAVIRGLPGGCGITLTSHIDHLVVQLHDILFRLSGPASTVDLRFSEQWFRLPAGWTEERLYAEEGLHFIDIAAPVENLARKLYAMHRQEEQELEKQRWETEEEREKRLQQEEAMRKREEEERRKIRERNVERMRRDHEAAAAAKRIPPVWDAALWNISEVQPAGNRYSKFKLSMNSNKQVCCEFVGHQGLREMLRRVEDGECVLPISKIAPKPATSRALETLGSVEGYCDLDTWGTRLERGHFMDRSGRTLSSVLMASRSPVKVFTIQVLTDKLDILLDDGMIVSCRYRVSIDIHCDDVSSSELLTTNWAYHILCKNTDGEGMTTFSTLLVQLKKKLQLQLTKEESDVYNMSRIDDEEENKDPAKQWRKQQEWVPAKSKHEFEEVELSDCGMLFPSPW